jgi:hypothetical protein
VFLLAPPPLPSKGGDPLLPPALPKQGRGVEVRARHTFLSRDQVETPSLRRKPGAPHWGLSLRGAGSQPRGRGASGEPGPAPHRLMNMNMNEPTGERKCEEAPAGWPRPRHGPGAGGVAWS